MMGCCGVKRVSKQNSKVKSLDIMGHDGLESIEIPAGSYRVGSDSDEGYADDFEGPSIIVNLETFWLDTTPVTNRSFAMFCEATNYITTAETMGSSFVFHLLLDEAQKREPIYGLPWWYDVKGASWRHPFGDQRSYLDYLDYPVVHVSMMDALMYCQWSGKRLPSEVEWEVACRGDYQHERYPWGEILQPKGEHCCNIWQGVFPKVNTEEDGYLGVAPAKSLYCSDNGLWQMIGNVWELCSNPSRIPLKDVRTSLLQEQLQTIENHSIEEYAAKGGSFLCHASYCNRYRTAARNGVDYLSSSSNVSFRCARDKEKQCEKQPY